MSPDDAKKDIRLGTRKKKLRVMRPDGVTAIGNL